MNQEELIKNLTSVLQTDKNLTVDTELSSLEEWDSLGMIATISYININLKKNFSFENLKNVKYIKDLVDILIE